MADISSRPNLPDWLRVGSHIRVRRVIYYHHGIYYGWRRVIHYSGLSANLIAKGQGRIERTTLRSLRADRKLNWSRTRHPFPKTRSSTEPKKDSDEKKYNVFWNNCEHFATGCMKGEPESPQIEAAVVGGLVGLLLHHVATARHPMAESGLVTGGTAWTTT